MPKTNPSSLPIPSPAWIWHSFVDAGRTHVAVAFRRCFQVSEEALREGLFVDLSADTRYRLFVNGKWVDDGPYRHWPAFTICNRCDLSGRLQLGENELRVEVVHFGVGTFQSVNGTPGVACRVWQGDTVILESDRSWMARAMEELTEEVPRFGCQLGFEEEFDARKQGEGDWVPVNQIRSVEEMGRTGFEVVDVPSLTRKPLPFSRLRRFGTWRPPGHAFTLRRDEMLSDTFGGSEMQRVAGVFRTRIECGSETRVKWLGNFAFDSLWIDGAVIPWESGSWLEGFRSVETDLSAGNHEVALSVCTEDSNINEILLSTHSSEPIRFVRLSGGEGSPWEAVKLPFDAKKVKEVAADHSVVDGWRPLTGKEDVVASASFRIRTGEKLMALPLPECGPIRLTPGKEGPLMLLFDLGEISVGWPELEVEAPSGTVVEGYGVEYIEHPGEETEWVQHMANKLNGFRVICGPGITRWVGRERRGMRYLFLNVEGPGEVVVHKVSLLESTYPTPSPAPFDCDEAALVRMHGISARTLQLCMEDTFTDCPSYEQVTWIGDARNEALFNYYVFGVNDIVRRTLDIGAQSLAGNDNLVCSFGPASSSMDIPAWAFLWGIAVSEAYAYTGDRRELCRLYPALRENLDRALARIDDNGLFRGAGMFDWTPIDHHKPYVTHNQQFLCKALTEGAVCAEICGESADAARFRERACSLAESIHTRLWIPERGGYADSLDDNGEHSECSCVHTLALGLLYDLIPEADRKTAMENFKAPPASFTGVGSPFAMFYIIEAWIHLDFPERAMEIVREYWGQMLEKETSTFWEMVEDDWVKGYSRKPTRSHCHGWSCAPLAVFAQVVLGIRLLKPGFIEVEIQPKPCGLQRASGVIPTPLGPLGVAWSLREDGSMDLEVDAPPGMKIVKG